MLKTRVKRWVFNLDLKISIVGLVFIWKGSVSHSVGGATQKAWSLFVIMFEEGTTRSVLVDDQSNLMVGG